MSRKTIGGGIVTVAWAVMIAVLDKILENQSTITYWLIMGAMSVLALIGLAFLFRSDKRETIEEEKQDMSSTFNNYGNVGQMGNITNNFGNVSLNLSDSDIEKLVRDTPRNLPVFIQYVGKPAGAHNMERLAAALRNSGLTVETEYFAMQMTSPPPTKIGMNQHDGKTNIWIAPDA